MAVKQATAWVPTKAPVTIPVYCESCANFKGRAIRQADSRPATCSQIGILPKARPCRDFMVDPFARELVELSEDKKLANLISRIKPNGLAALSALLVGEIDTRRFGFHFGQTVYVNIMAVGTNEPGNDRDFLANYYRGQIISIGSDGVAYVSHKQRMRLAVNVNAILNIQEWRARRSYLLEQRRFVDKANPYSWERKISILKDPTTRPPWLDDALIKYATKNTVDADLVLPTKARRGRKKRAASDA